MNALVCVQHREAITTSLKIAEIFCKRHDRVVEAIKRLIGDLPTATHPFFRVSGYMDSTGRRLTMFEMNRDGFSFLVMGFTGKRALMFKLQFIEAFNHMEAALLQRHNLAWQEARGESKIARRSETDTISKFVVYASNQGSKNARNYYMNLTKMTHKALAIVKQASPQSFRDMLDTMQLSFLATAEHIVRETLEDGMYAGLHYKDIYQLARERVERYAGTLPKQRMLMAA